MVASTIKTNRANSPASRPPLGNHAGDEHHGKNGQADDQRIRRGGAELRHRHRQQHHREHQAASAPANAKREEPDQARHKAVDQAGKHQRPGQADIHDAAEQEPDHLGQVKRRAILRGVLKIDVILGSRPADRPGIARQAEVYSRGVEPDIPIERAKGDPAAIDRAAETIGHSLPRLI